MSSLLERCSWASRFRSDPDSIPGELAKYLGEAWKPTISRVGTLPVPAHSTSPRSVADCYRIQFSRGKSKLNFYYRHDDTSENPFFPNPNAPSLHRSSILALNVLVYIADQGWPVAANMAIVRLWSNKDGTGLRPTNGAKLAGWAPRGRVRVAVRAGIAQLALVPQTKVPGANHYQAICLPHDLYATSAELTDTIEMRIDDVLKLTEREVERIENGAWPPPLRFEADEYELDPPRAYRHHKTAINLMRCTTLMSTEVGGMGTLRPDGTISLDMTDPDQTSVWFIVTVKTYSGCTYQLATNGEEYYYLAGQTYLRLSTERHTLGPRLTRCDGELLRAAIKHWVEASRVRGN